MYLPTVSGCKLINGLIRRSVKHLYRHTIAKLYFGMANNEKATVCAATLRFLSIVCPLKVHLTPTLRYWSAVWLNFLKRGK